MTQECAFAHLSPCPLEVCNCRRASTTPPGEKPHADTPKLWRDMAPEEKGALLLAHHEGQSIQSFGVFVPDTWCAEFPEWEDNVAYRIRPQQTRETVNANLCITQAGKSLHMRPDYSDNYYGDGLSYFTLTFDLVDDKLDPSSIKIKGIEQ